MESRVAAFEDLPFDADLARLKLEEANLELVRLEEEFEERIHAIAG